MATYSRHGRPGDKAMTSKQDDAGGEKGWLERLGRARYHVMREKGTEPPFTGEHWDNHEAGTYTCSGCGKPLFSSDDKFESGTGWPSFTAPVDGNAVATTDDRSHGMVRTEVLCKECGGHLGHVFPDGPRSKGGNRYCINSISLDFQPRQDDG